MNCNTRQNYSEHRSSELAQRSYWVPPTHNDLLDRDFPQADSFLSCEEQFDGRCHRSTIVDTPPISALPLESHCNDTEIGENADQGNQLWESESHPI